MKDWTWVIERPCPECAFDPAGIAPPDYASAIRQVTLPWHYLLTRPSAARRPEPRTWSALEYGCHVRDVCRIFQERTQLMLHRDDPLFANWDQDAAAIEGRYHLADPDTTRAELAAAAATLAATYADIPQQAWERTGRRSNGSTFTVRTLGRYLLHDLSHHLWDVRG